MTANSAIIGGLLYLLYAGFYSFVLPFVLPLVGLVATRFMAVWSQISLLALPRASQLFRVLSKPKPAERPPEAIIWPIRYLGCVFSHNRGFGAL